LKPCRYSRCSF